jgi:hypothetical protein
VEQYDVTLGLQQQWVCKQQQQEQQQQQSSVDS